MFQTKSRAGVRNFMLGKSIYSIQDSYRRLRAFFLGSIPLRNHYDLHYDVSGLSLVYATVSKPSVVVL